MKFGDLIYKTLIFLWRNFKNYIIINPHFLLLQVQLFYHIKDKTLVCHTQQHTKFLHILRNLSGNLSSICSFLFLDAVDHSAISCVDLPQPMQKLSLSVQIFIHGETTLEIDFTGATCTGGCSECINIGILSFLYVFFPVDSFKC